mmetsp:Transcript_32292/g.54746  ORF Transcript_32292/g.54746 Transcript_32292/m.54746 type:complete len:824 (+) Transcript_32292:157-2628(+)
MDRIMLSLRSEERSTQLLAVSELCEILSLASEDLLQSFSPQEITRSITEVLADQKTSPDVKLIAIRCLNNLMAALPSSATIVATASVVTSLCENVRTICYIDVAEEALIALGKISQANPTGVIEEGGLSAIMTNLPFFPIRVQRSAMETAAELMEKASLHPNMGIECLPRIGDRLEPYTDSKVRALAVRMFACATRTLAGNPGFIDLMLSSKLRMLPKLFRILSDSCTQPDWTPKPSDENVVRQILRSLAMLSRSSKEFFEQVMRIPIPMIDVKEEESEEGKHPPPIARMVHNIILKKRRKSKNDAVGVSTPSSATGFSSLSTSMTIDCLSLAVALCPEKYSFRFTLDKSTKCNTTKSTAATSTVVINPKSESRRRKRGTPSRPNSRRAKVAVRNPSVVVIETSEKEELQSKTMVIVRELFPVFVTVGSVCEYEVIRELCISGISCLLGVLKKKRLGAAACSSSKVQVIGDGGEQLDDDRNSDYLHDFPQFTIELLRSGKTSQVVHGLTMADQLLESQEATPSVIRKFAREGVFSLIRNMAKLLTTPSSQTSSCPEKKKRKKKKRRKITTTTASGKRSIDENISEPSSYFFVESKIPESVARKAGNVLRKWEKRLLLMASEEKENQHLQNLVTQLERLIVSTNITDKRKELRKTKINKATDKGGEQTLQTKLRIGAYDADREVLRKLAEILQPNRITTFELLSSGIVPTLCRYLGADSPSIPPTFDCMRSIKDENHVCDNNDALNYRLDAALLLRRAAALDTILLSAAGGGTAQGKKFGSPIHIIIDDSDRKNKSLSGSSKEHPHHHHHQPSSLSSASSSYRT